MPCSASGKEGSNSHVALEGEEDKGEDRGVRNWGLPAGREGVNGKKRTTPPDERKPCARADGLVKTVREEGWQRCNGYQRNGILTTSALPPFFAFELFPPMVGVCVWGSLGCEALFFCFRF